MQKTRLGFPGNTPLPKSLCKTVFMGYRPKLIPSRAPLITHPKEYLHAIPKEQSSHGYHNTKEKYHPGRTSPPGWFLYYDLN